MGVFITNNITLIVIATAIVLTMIIKISSKPEYISLTPKDFLDFGFDLSISSIILVLTEIGKRVEQASLSSSTEKASIITGVWIILIGFVLLMMISIFINRKGWDKAKKEPNLWGILLPDLLGLGYLVAATMFVGGKII